MTRFVYKFMYFNKKLFSDSHITAVWKVCLKVR